MEQQQLSNKAQTKILITKLAVIISTICMPFFYYWLRNFIPLGRIGEEEFFILTLFGAAFHFYIWGFIAMGYIMNTIEEEGLDPYLLTE